MTGARKGAVRAGDDRTYSEKVADAWGEAPDWVAELAAYADAHSAKVAADAVGYSAATLSVVMNRAASIEKFDIGRIEQAVRGALMGLTVVCPVIGEMSRHTCLDWQTKPKAATSAYRMRMYHACRSGCPHFRSKGSSNGTE